MNESIARRTTALVASTALLASVLVTAMAAPVAAGPANLKDCAGWHTGETYLNVWVPEGGWCTLSAGTTVMGSVKVLEGARLDLYKGTEVRQNVVAKDGSILYSPGGAVIGGNVQQHNGAQIIMGGTTVGGDVEIKKDHHGFNPSVAIATSVIAGNIRLYGNDWVDVRSSTIGGNCHAKDNTGPVNFIGNTVEGNVLGQCSS